MSTFSVQFIYAHFKATHLFAYPIDRARIIEGLRRDLDVLRIGQPISDNITIMPPSTIRFCWPGLTKSSSLYRDIYRKLWGEDARSADGQYLPIFAERGISRRTYRWFVDDPPRDHDVASTQRTDRRNADPQEVERIIDASAQLSQAQAEIARLKDELEGANAKTDVESTASLLQATPQRNAGASQTPHEYDPNLEFGQVIDSEDKPKPQLFVEGCIGEVKTPVHVLQIGGPNAMSMERIMLRLDAAEEEVRREVKRRKIAEMVLEDVRQERGDPFIVPALLEAFGLVARVVAESDLH